MAAFLHVFHYNGLYKTLELDKTQKYVIGRRKNCSVVLEDYKGISREHFEVYFEDGIWKLKVLSQYGYVQVNGEDRTEIFLEQSQNFELPPYRFEFVLQADTQQIIEPEVEEAAEPEVPQYDNPDRTMVGQLAATPFLKFLSGPKSGQPAQRLEGHSPWVVGRDAQAAFKIDDQQVSRQQFEIFKKGAAFYIKDLGSVNGTIVNGHKIPAKKKFPLNGGDLIQILDHMLEFEIHDNDFSERIDSKALVTALAEETPPEPMSPVLAETPVVPPAYQYSPQIYQQPQYNSAQYQTAPTKPASNSKAIFFRVLIVAIAAGGGIAYYFQEQQPKEVAVVKKVEVKDLGPLAQLPPDKQAAVKQSYTVAKNYYMQGKYASAKGEMIKIKEFVPEYLDSEEILKLSEEAINMQEQRIKADLIEQSKKETEEKIEKKVAECRKLITPTVTTQEVEQCLSEVLQFNPDHPAFAELRGKAEQITEDRALKEAERKRSAGLVLQMRSIFETAKKKENPKDPIRTIEAYEKVLAAKLPDPDGLKHQAERKIASIKNQMSEQSVKFAAEADKLHTENKTKAAIIALRKAKEANPLDDSYNGKIELWTKELRKQVMEYYQEGILEESYGNIDGSESKPGAKDKWKKIIELDIPDGEYYKKAVIKLKKYGAI